MTRSGLCAAGLLLVAAGLAGCGADPILLLAVASPHELGADTDGAPEFADLAEADGPDGVDGGPTFDLGPTASGPVHLSVVDTSTDSCAAVIAARSLRQALCACDGLSLGAQLSTTAFNSSGGGVDPRVSAAVATNHGLTTTASVAISGSLFVFEPLSLGDDARSVINEVLHVGGTVHAGEDLSVHGDAYVGGDITGALDMTPLNFGLPMAQTLYVPDAVMSLGSGMLRGVAVKRGPVSVPQECNCDPTEVPVADLVAAVAASNDNASIGLDPNRYANYGPGVLLSLPAGRFFLNLLSTQQRVPLTIAVHGAAGLYVNGGVLVSGDVTVVLDEGASLDVVFTGDLACSGTTFGDTHHPARVRLWSGSKNEVQFPVPGTTLAALLHAPEAGLVAPYGLTVRGALLVRDASIGGRGGLGISFDRAVLGQGQVECGTMPSDPLK